VLYVQFSKKIHKTINRQTVDIATVAVAKYSQLFFWGKEDETASTLQNEKKQTNKQKQPGFVVSTS
jgi:hypothetical protein